MSHLKVTLFRDSFNTPWGFRLQGGKDLKQPLQIQRVFTNSPAEGELQRGDVIVSINDRNTSSFTHKQAQDTIKFGGGQLNLVIERPPPGRVHIAPLTPTSSTKAPSFPTKPPSIIIPIQRRHSGPPSPIKNQMSFEPGFRPKKVTMNKFGGGGYDFGTAHSPQYKPVQPPFHSPPQQQHQQHHQQQQYHQQQHYQQQQQQQQQYAPVSPPQQHAGPTFASSYRVEQHVQQSNLPPEERGVEEEEYGGVNERRRQFMKGEQRQALTDVDEIDYPTESVWERRRLFTKAPAHHQAIHRSNKTFKPRRPFGDDAATFGVDYTHGVGMPTAPTPKPASRPRPPAVNASQPEDEYDAGPSPWSNTLKGKGLKLWEQEAMIQEAYQGHPSQSVYRPAEAPPPTQPKPRITQITTQSKARPTQQQQQQQQHPVGHRSVSPNVPRKPQRSPTRSPTRPQQQQQQQYHHVAPPSAPVSGVPADKVVHLQYNTPIGLYSKQNIQDTYVGQTQARAPVSPASPTKKPAAPGDRDWNDSYVYRMLQEETKTTSSHGSPGQPGQTVTKTKVTKETNFPGQSPQRTVTETVSRGPGDSRYYDDEIGISDF